MGKVVYRGYIDAFRLKDVDSTVTNDIPGVTVKEAVKVMRDNGIVSKPGKLLEKISGRVGAFV